MIVDISEGVRLSDANAQRCVSYMLEDLTAYVDRANVMLKDMFDRKCSVANPIAQRRTFDRIVKAMGPTLLEHSITTGKKGSFIFCYSSFLAGNKGLGISTVKAEAPRFRRGEVDVKDHVLLIITRHALQRLVQRCDVRRSEDYVPILKALAVPALVMAAAAVEGVPPDATWPLPITFSGKRILMLCRQEEGGLPTVTTALKGSWRDSPDLDALHELLDGALQKPWDIVERARPLFISASRHFTNQMETRSVH
jgi:hypothetical protein